VTNEKLLVINADDLGMNPGVNAGILTGIEHGVISDTSLLVCAEHTGAAVEGLGYLGIKHVGIHINLDGILGWKPGGIEIHPRTVLTEMLRDERFLRTCASEARNQIDRFLGFNLVPSHLDTHHHIHGFLPIFHMLIDLMKEYDIPAMRFSGNGYRLPTRVNIPYNRETYLRMESLLEEKEIYFCDGYLEDANNIAEVSDRVTELAVHPSLSGDVWRCEDMVFLMSENGVASLRQRGVRLVSYHELVRAELPCLSRT